MTNDDSRRTTRRRWLPVAALMLLGLALSVSACGSRDGDGVATAGGDTSATVSSTAASQGDPYKFAQCMRDNGIADWPDPEADTGSLRNGGGGPGRVMGPDNADPQQVQTTMEKCKQYLPNGGDAPDASDNSSMLAFAQCMRDHGISNFPDPPADGGNFGLAPDIDQSSPEFQAAQAACSQYVQGGHGPSGAGG